MSFNNPNVLPYPPYSSPMVDRNGTITPAWQKWFQLLWPRVGGANAAPLAQISNTNPSNLISQLLSESLSTIYAAQIGQKAIINSFSLENLDIAARTVSLYLVPAGGTPGTSNVVVSNLSIPAGSAIAITALQFQVLQSGASLQTVASISSVIQASATGWVTT